MQSRFDEKGRFIIEDYLRKPTFASFLPGIAGLNGIPLWVFYVNRGQGIASFGVESKDNPIMEFQPANKAYQSTPLLGFRTFLKFGDGSPARIYEPFSDAGDLSHRSTRLLIGPNEFEIREADSLESLETSVLYFILPGERFSGLVRRVTVRNLSSGTKRFELLDGLPAIVPFGINNYFMKEMSNVAMAWMGVENVENKIPYYKIHSSIEDTPEIEQLQAGHFYLCFHDYRGEISLLPPLVDAALVFGSNTSLTLPRHFLEHPLRETYEATQIRKGRVPCGFFGGGYELGPGEALTISAVVGHVDEVSLINGRAGDLTRKGHLDEKLMEARALSEELTSAVATETSSASFDLYVRQNYLDNLLRGGTPVLFPAAEGDHVFYVYSRKHGDLEREYNFFTISPENYSQGNGNYRDINQNRRSDVLLHPAIDDYLVGLFTNLIQTDGYNPLVIKGSTFEIEGPALAEILKLVSGRDRERVGKLLSKQFTPGSLLRFLNNHNVGLSTSHESFLRTVLAASKQYEHADHVEGYWVDHWTYTLDLIDSYLAIFPEKKRDLLFSQKKYTFYDNAAVVVPRSEKYVLVKGQVKQLNAVQLDAGKEALITGRTVQPHAMRSLKGRGGIYRTTLISKLLCLASVKFSLLDAGGMGIEMEAEKPGWYDALNGLPALFGSSLSETYELKRLLEFLRDALSEFSQDAIGLPQEVWALLREMECEVERSAASPDDYRYWDTVSGLREQYREKTKYGLSGDEVQRTGHDLAPLLQKLIGKVEQGIGKAIALNKGVPLTFLRFDPLRWELNRDGAGAERKNSKGQSTVRILQFNAIALPLFLEGAVKAMKLSASHAEAEALSKAIARSELRDAKLSMYKVNASLKDQPASIGRARAFTPGWLENESVFLHMQYKYFLAMLRAGLYSSCFDEMKHLLVPFYDPDVYGRSILENSTFLASSVHPDPTMHGRGFVARMSGSTAEFLSIWFLMMMGDAPFLLSPNGVALRFAPCIPHWLFKDDSTISFTFLSSIKVTYHNRSRKDLFPGCGIPAKRIVIQDGTATGHEIHGDVVEVPWSLRIREGKVNSIDVYFDTEEWQKS